MKNLLLIVFVLIIFDSGCINKPSLKVQVIQKCLDDMYVSKKFEYFKKSPLILIKNQYSQDLKNLHFGENKIILKDMSSSEQKVVLGSLKSRDSSFFEIYNYKINKDKAEVGIYYPMISLNINLTRSQDNWTIKDAELIMDDNVLIPPPHKHK